MRAVKKNFKKPPASLLSNNLSIVITTTDPKKRGKKINRRYYADPSVVRKLKQIYKNRCAYCECYEPKPQVEHYRPKLGVTGETHEGYYWLCYEWSNLFPACYYCNKQGAKGNKFPIAGTRQTKPIFKTCGSLNQQECVVTSNTLNVQECPLLLNPEVPGFDPFKYFKINASGKLIPKPRINTLDYRKAKETIDVVDLNRQKLLLTVRRKYIREYMYDIKMIMYEYENDNLSEATFERYYLRILKKINTNAKVQGQNEYTFFWTYFLVNFKSFLKKHLIEPYRTKAHQAYDKMITKV